MNISISLLALILLLSNSLIGADQLVGVTEQKLLLIQNNDQIRVTALDGSVLKTIPLENFYKGKIQSASFSPSGKLLIQAWNRPLRYHADGRLDRSFRIGKGFLRNVYESQLDFAFALPSERLLFTGDFDNYNGALLPGISVLEPDGSLDLTTSPSAKIKNPWEWAGIAVRPDGKILIAAKSEIMLLDDSLQDVSNFKYDGAIGWFQKQSPPLFSIHTDNSAIVIWPGSCVKSAHFFDALGKSKLIAFKDKVDECWPDANGKIPDPPCRIIESCLSGGIVGMAHDDNAIKLATANGLLVLDRRGEVLESKYIPHLQKDKLAWTYDGSLFADMQGGFLIDKGKMYGGIVRITPELKPDPTFSLTTYIESPVPQFQKLLSGSYHLLGQGKIDCSHTVGGAVIQGSLEVTQQPNAGLLFSFEFSGRPLLNSEGESSPWFRLKEGFGPVSMVTVSEPVNCQLAGAKSANCSLNVEGASLSATKENWEIRLDAGKNGKTRFYRKGPVITAHGNYNCTLTAEVERNP